jgi:hypothetical protein
LLELRLDQSIALLTRRTFIADHVDRDVLVLGTHFTTPAVGHIVREKDDMRFVAVEVPSDGQSSATSRPEKQRFITAARADWIRAKRAFAQRRSLIAR